MHEQSETIQNEDGKWINVYGRKTPNAGKPLPQIHNWERTEYDSLEEAESAASRRSNAFRNGYDTPVPK